MAWREFEAGKGMKADVQKFKIDLVNSLFALGEDLRLGNYRHGGYYRFVVYDPKRRQIHKATVRDRVLHHALFRVLSPIFDKLFIFDSYSCRVGKGTHRGVVRLADFIRRATHNYRRPAYALKLDIKKFFDSIDHRILFELIKRRVADADALRLIRLIISSFETAPQKGLPLGNVTSQLFANIYLNELDQFVKHILREKLYLRYADDFVIVHESREYLEALILKLSNFLGESLRLELHPQKIILRKVSHGVDFLGYVVLPHYTVLRTKTKKRVLKKIEVLRRNLSAGIITPESFNQSIQSYLGMLAHCKGFAVRRMILRGVAANLQKQF